LTQHSGDMVAARDPGDADHPVLGDAPGTYVAVKARPEPSR